MAGLGNTTSGYDTTIQNAYLNIIGGTFQNSAHIYGGATTNNQTEKANVKYNGSLYINVQNQGSLQVNVLSYWISPVYNVPENLYIITDSMEYFDQRKYYSTFRFDSAGTHSILVNQENKTYTMKEGDTVETGADMVIQADYSMIIPEGVTVKVPEGETLTNKGMITIRGTLINNGTITDHGSIVSQGGTFNGHNPSSGAVINVAESVGKITLGAGEGRATTRITDILAPEAEHEQYYRVYNVAPASKGQNTTICLNQYMKIDGQTTGDIPAPLNGCLEVCEVSGNQVQKYSQVMISENELNGNISYDSLSSDIVSCGSSDYSTKITAMPDAGNKLYYRLDAPEEAYYYNSILDTANLTKVESGADITAEKGKFLSVYEINEAGLLRKAVRVELTVNNMTLQNYGLVCDEANKRIFCNGQTVRLSVAKSDEPQLYVLKGDEWKAAVPSGLPFERGSLKGYTLYGGSNLTEETGTCFLEYPNKSYLTFQDMPSAIQNFTNYISPDLKQDTKNYTVKGTIDLNRLHSTYRDFSQLDFTGVYNTAIHMKSLTLEAGASLTTVPVENGYNGRNIVFEGGKEQIHLETGASIQGEQNILYQPQIEIRFYQQNGVEYPKKNGKYQIAPNKPLTIAATYSADGTVPQLSILPAPTTVSVTDVVLDYDTVFGSYLDCLPWEGFCFDFFRLENKSSRYYTGDSLHLQKATKDGMTVITSAITIADITSVAAPDRVFRAICMNQEQTAAPETRFIRNYAEVEYEYTKNVQEFITTNLTDRYVLGTEPFHIDAQGGTVSVNAPFVYNSSNPSVASVDGEGNLSLLSGGKTTITVSKAGNEDYEPAIYEKEIEVVLLDTAAPVITPDSCDFINEMSVSMSCETPGAQIYYTTDGSVPSVSSHRYEKPVILTKTTTLKAIAIAENRNDSEVVMKNYTYKLLYNPLIEKSGAEQQNPANPAAVGYADVTMKKNSFVYTGSTIRPAVSVKYTYVEYDDKGEKSGKAKTKKLKENVDYTVTYENAINAAKADAANNAPTVVITGRGDYEGVLTKTFAITPKNIKKVKAEHLPDFVYTGNDLAEAVKSELILTDGVNIVSPSDYEVAFSADTKGSADADTKLTLTITGKEGGNYTGTMKQKPVVMILAKTEGKTNLSFTENVLVTLKQDLTKKPMTYNGKAQKPAVVVKTADGKKVAAKNYKLIYKNNVQAGNTAEVTVVGRNQYYGKQTVSFSIAPKDFSRVKVTGLSKLMFQKTIADLNPLVKDGSTILIKDRDYTLSANEITSGGFLSKKTMTVELTFTPTTQNPNYAAGTNKVMKVILVKRNLTNRLVTKVTLNADSVPLGTNPAVTVTCYGERLVEGRDYTVTYKNNQKAGKAKVMVKGMGDYTGSRTLKYQVTK